MFIYVVNKHRQNKRPHAYAEKSCHEHLVLVKQLATNNLMSRDRYTLAIWCGYYYSVLGKMWFSYAPGR